MVAVVDDRLVFGRDQVLTSTQAGKNFGEARRRARKGPLFVSDRNDGIDTVIIGYDEFESMALEIERLRDELLRARAAERLAEADAGRAGHPVPFDEAAGAGALQALVDAEAGDPVPDAELFE